jgi:hypothetical protein
MNKKTLIITVSIFFLLGVIANVPAEIGANILMWLCCGTMAYGVWFVYIELTTDELKAQRRLNTEYTRYCASLATQLPLQVYRCVNKNEFDRWGNASLGRMEMMLDQYEDFVRNLPKEMQKLYSEYKAYSDQTALLYQHIDGHFLTTKQTRFKKRIQSPPDNIIMRVHVTYTSPRGRNSYSARYEMQYKDVIAYLKTFPTSENTYLPDAFIRPNNKFIDCAGTYVLCNQEEDKYYVGQATSFQRRLHQHFTGKGNPDVYFDYRSGKPFTIYLFPLNGSRFHNLNDQERHYIAKYRAFEEGYNKTHGNT